MFSINAARASAIFFLIFIPSASADTLINEVDSDQVGTDGAEFIELYDGGVGNTDLSGTVLVLFNGSTDVSYQAYDLDGQNTSGDGYFVLCGNAANVANCDLDVSPNTNLLQNGADAVALFSGDASAFPNGTPLTTVGLLDAIVYDTNDSDDSGLLQLLNVGQPQIDEGGSGDQMAHSNQRCTNGSGGARNTDSYIQALPSPGIANACGSPPPSVGLCGEPATKIHVIQGEGLSSPETGNVHIIEAVVVGDFQTDTQLNGFFVQEEDADVDADPMTSEGIFTLAPAAIDVNVGDVVRIQGTVSEFFERTELSNITGLTVCGSGGVATASQVALPVGSIIDFEAFEGMLVNLPQTLYITEHFNFGHFGEVELATSRQFQPTAVFEPGSIEQASLVSENLLNRIILDDGRTDTNPDPAIHPNGDIFDLNNLFRAGDSVQNVTGVMDYRLDQYRIQPTQGANYTSLNPRPALPSVVGGSLTVASMNLLNYFTTLAEGGDNCGPLADLNCRGADNASELTRQRDKIVSAIVTMDADIVGLMEVENHIADTALTDLVSGLNTVAGAGTYEAISTGTIGDDAIKVALIYKPVSVSPVGAFAILDSSVNSSYIDDRNRPALAQTFEQNGTASRFTVVVNHLKSKASTCDDIADPDTGDGQGNCSLTRTSAAEAEIAWLATDPTNSGDADFLVIGDLNAYDKEDPIEVFLTDGYTDLLKEYSIDGEFAYSYVFDGQSGYLNHALASADLLNQITGATVWHINADEPDLINYDTSFKQLPQQSLYEANAFRSSDHDPVLIGLELSGDSDSDGDGVLDDMDACPDSDLSPTVVINSCDSGVPNQTVMAGCSIMDGINACSLDSQGKLFRCVSRLTKNLKFTGVITGKQKSRIKKCAKVQKGRKWKKGKWKSHFSWRDHSHWHR